MPRKQVTGKTLLKAGFRRRPWQVIAGAVAAMVAAGALFATLSLLMSIERLLAGGLGRLGADLVVAPKGHSEAVLKYMRDGGALEIPPGAPATVWMEQIKKARVLGVEAMETEGSVVLIRLDGWFSPLLAAQEIGTRVPDAEVVIAEQAARTVGRGLQPLVKHLGPASLVALLGAVLLTALLTAIRVGERRSELGMLRAVGATRGWILRLTLGEVVLLGLLGGTVGVLMGGIGVAMAVGMVLSFTEVALLALGTVLLTVVAMGLAALAPALKASVLDPLEAVRRI